MRFLLALGLLLTGFSVQSNEIKTFSSSSPYCFYEEKDCLKMKDHFEGQSIPNGSYEAICTKNPLLKNHPYCPDRAYLMYLNIHLKVPGSND